MNNKSINLELVKFIKNNPDWEIKLKNDPFFITIKRNENFIIFNYSQVDSDFYNSIVKECRGIILEDITFKPVCVPFYKFGNYGEGYVDQIDWNTAIVQKKIDGSIIKVWNYYKDGMWRVSTNGMIDAKDAPLKLENNISNYKNFYELFENAAKKTNLNFDNLDVNKTYMFELTSPFNRVVISYDDISITHIGTRDINTLEECDDYIGIPKPERYPIYTIEKCIETASKLPFSEEGYVVVDSNWNRIKIKSPAYVAMHHLVTNEFTKEDMIRLIKNGEYIEVVNYFPEYAEQFDELNQKISKFIDEITNVILEAGNTMFENRKAFAEFAKNAICPAIMFNWYDGKLTCVKDWLFSNTDKKILMYIDK